MDNMFYKKKWGVLTALFCMFLWGSAFPVLKLSYQELQIPPEDFVTKIYFAGIRFFLSGILVLLFYLFFNKGKRGKIDIKFLILLGIIQTAVQYIFFYIGVGNTSGVKSAILQASSTFLIVLFSHFIFKDDSLTLRKTAALIFGFGGVFAANISMGLDLNFRLTGEGFLLLSSMANALGTILVKLKGKDMNPMIMTMGQMIFGSLLLLIPGRILLPAPLVWTPFALGLLFYSAFISSAAFTLWYELLKHYKSGEISVYQLFIPIFGSFLSLALLPKEYLNYNLIIGLILVCIGIWILNRKRLT